MFTDRKDAGRRLGGKLLKYRGKDAVVLALPRGGVVVGYEIARMLNLPLDVIVVRKVGHPANSEYAIGAVDEKESFLGNENETKSVDPNWLKEEILLERNEALRRIRAYRGGQKRVEIKGKTVILVDDGIATGLTIRVAVQSIRGENPKELVVAVPVAPEEAITELRREVDRVVVLEGGRSYLGAVGAYYSYFPQTSDQEVVELLRQAEHNLS